MNTSNIGCPFVIFFLLLHEDSVGWVWRTWHWTQPPFSPQAEAGLDLGFLMSSFTSPCAVGQSVKSTTNRKPLAWIQWGKRQGHQLFISSVSKNNVFFNFSLWFYFPAWICTCMCLAACVCAHVYVPFLGNHWSLFSESGSIFNLKFSR